MKYKINSKELDIAIDPELDRIALLFSGGMDSTLLLYMLLQEKYNKGLNTEIYCFTADQPGRFHHSSKILKLPEFKDKVFHRTDVDNPTPEGIKPFVRTLCDNNWVMYSAANKNPDVEIGGRYPGRRMDSPNVPSNLNFVFKDLFKHEILGLYYQLGIEHLIPYTSSCTEVETGRCNLCFACRERAWAFNVLNKTEQIL